MLSRTHQSSIAGRSASIRRMRRRSQTTRFYCRTNGCASILEIHPEGGIASCRVCGYSTRID
jgi:transcription elongation factor Elf1